MRESFRKHKAKIIVGVLLVAVLSVGGSLAVLTDVSASITNTFKAAQNVNTEIKETVGDITDSDSEDYGKIATKTVAVKNDGPSNALIRVRVTCSPDLVSDSFSDTTISLLKDSELLGEALESQDAKWADGGDGYYYYLVVTKKGDVTTTLFDQVAIGSQVTSNFDVTVYQEGVFSDLSAGTSVSLEDAQEAFKTVTAQ